jgi:hypothetical protein
VLDKLEERFAELEEKYLRSPMGRG